VGGSLRDALGFLLANFSEMNRLWVRMQHGIGAAAKGRKRRERERQELRILVGSNLTRLASLGGLGLTVYAEQVLPRVLGDVVVGCKDEIAQGYLLDSLLAVFPVEYHLHTLDALLTAVGQILPRHAVVRAVLTALLGRVKEAALDGSLNLGALAVTASRSSSFGAGGSAGAAADGAYAAPGTPASGGGDVRSSSSSTSAAPAPASPASGAAADGALLPPSLDVFGRVLRRVAALASDPTGPFSSAAAAQAAAAAAEATGGVPAPGAAAAAASDALAALVSVYAALLDFAVCVYPDAHTAAVYANDVLAGVSGSLGRILYGGAEAYAALLAGRKRARAAEGDDEAPPPALRQRSPAAAAALARLLSDAAKAGADDDDAAAAESTVGDDGTPAAAAPAAAAADAGGSGDDVAMATGDAAAAAAPLTPPVLPPALGEEPSRALVSLLERVQARLGLGVLTLEAHAECTRLLRPPHQRAVANALLSAVLASGKRITTVATTRRLFRSLAPLMTPAAAPVSTLARHMGAPAGSVDAETVREQRSIARLVLRLGGTTDATLPPPHGSVPAGKITVPGLDVPGVDDAEEDAVALAAVASSPSGSGETGGGNDNAAVAAAVAASSSSTAFVSSAGFEDGEGAAGRGTDVDAHFAVLRVALPFLTAAPAAHLPLTLPAVVVAAMGLVGRVRAAPAPATSPRQVLAFVHAALSSLAAATAPRHDQALRLWLQAASTAGEASFAYECFCQGEQERGEKERACGSMLGRWWFNVVSNRVRARGVYSIC
jgi:hypothetical protein